MPPMSTVMVPSTALACGDVKLSVPVMYVVTADTQFVMKRVMYVLYPAAVTLSWPSASPVSSPSQP